MTRKTKMSKRIISYILILTLLLTSVLIALPAEVTAVSQVIEETPEYPSVQNGGVYIYTYEDFKAMQTKYNYDGRIDKTYGQGNTYETVGDTYNLENYTTFILQNDIEITKEIGNMSYFHLNGMNTEGRVCTLQLNGAKYIFGWGIDVSFKNLKITGKILINDDSYTNHVAPLVMHGVDGHCVLENITSSVEIVIQRWGKSSSGTQRVGGVISKLDANNPYCGDNNDLFKNVVFDGKITFEATAPVQGQVGGIVGCGTTAGSHLTMEDCQNNGTIEIKSDLQGYDIGGILGEINSDADISRCTNRGDIIITGDYSDACIGGLVGSSAYSTSRSFTINFTDCDNIGNIECTAPYMTYVEYVDGVYQDTHITTGTDSGTTYNQVPTTAEIGGLVGELLGYASFANDYAHTVSFIRCRNLKDETGANVIKTGNARSTNVGGLAGRTALVNLTVNFCSNDSNIISSNVVPSDDDGSHAGVGGLVGSVGNAGSYQIDGNQGITGGVCKWVTRTVVVKNSINGGSITVASGSKNFAMGGLVGRAAAAPYVTFERCVNDGNLTAPSNYGWSSAGGIIGSYMTIATVKWDEDLKSGAGYNFTWSALEGGELNIKNCYNNGNVSGLQAGGMLGYGPQLCDNDIDIIIDSCYNKGDITAQYSAGGMVGNVGDNGQHGWELFGSLTFNCCVNEGDITAGDSTGDLGVLAGGILGGNYGDSDANTYVSGTVSTNKDNDTDERTTFNYCTNTGTVNALSKSGTSVADVYVYVAEIFGATRNYTVIEHAYLNNNIAQINGTNYATGGAGADANNRWCGYCHVADNHNFNSADDCTVNDTTGIGVVTNYVKLNSGIITTPDEYYNALKISVEKSIYYVKKTETTPRELSIVYGEDTGSDGLLYLMNDIALTEAIEKADNQNLNDGFIYGNGHTVTLSGNAQTMIWGIYGESCGVYDLNIAGNITQTSGTSHISPLSNHGVANNCDFALRNVHSTVNITVPASSTGVYAIGGVLTKIETGTQDVYFENVTYSGNIDINQNLNNASTLASDDTYRDLYNSVGGILGQMKGVVNATFIDCSTSGSITIGGSYATTTNGVGGIVGELQAGDLIMRYCSNSATITDENSTKYYNVGGIAGEMGVGAWSGADSYTQMRGGKIIGCSNTGNLTGKNVGGIIGASKISGIGGSGTFDVFAATNSGTITGVSAAGGIIGDTSVDTARTYSLKSRVTNVGDVTSTGVSGGIVGKASSLVFDNAANTGDVVGGTNVGGVIGEVTTHLEAEGVINHGDVSGTNNVGGVAGSVDSGDMYFYVAVNGGDVTASGATAAGIVAATSAPGTVNASANAGTISATTNIAGIVGTATAAVKVESCYNTGVMGENAYPMSKPGLNVTTDDRAGNLYKRGTVADTPDVFTLSTCCEGAAIREAVESDVFWAYDTNGIENMIELAEQAMAQGIYNDTQKAAINTAISNARALTTADWTDENSWAYQSHYNEADDAIYNALNVTDSINSKADYVVYIPEEVPAADTVEEAAPQELTVKLLNYNVFTVITVTLNCDMTLENTATPEDTISYKVLLDGKELADGDVVAEFGGDSAVTATEKEFTGEIKAVTTSTNIVAGDYRDPINFSFECKGKIEKTFPEETT